MIRFERPDAFLLLLIIPFFILFYVWALKRKKRLLERFISLPLQGRLVIGPSNRSGLLHASLIIGAMIVAIIALADPRWGYHWEETKRRGVDIMISIDISESMLAEDVKPNRLERAKREIYDLLGILKGDRIGVTIFKGSAYVYCPLTLDYNAVKLFLDDVNTDLIDAPGTAIADAISVSAASLSKTEKQSRSIILITDGENLTGDLSKAIEEAKQLGIRIFTIGMGKPEGAPIPLNQGFKKDRDGKIILTRLDENALKDVALSTGGAYVRSVTGDFDLENLYNDLKSHLKDKDLEQGRVKRFEARFQWFVLVAIFLILCEFFISYRKIKPLSIILLFAFALTIPYNAQAFTTKTQQGEELYKQGKYEDAAKAFSQEQVERPDNLSLKYNNACAYYKAKDYQNAETLFKSAAQQAEKSFESSQLLKDKDLAQKSYYNLGNANFRLSKFQDAIANYEKALTLAPQDGDAKFNLELAKKKLEEQKKSQQEQDKQQNDKSNEKDKQDNQQNDKSNEQDKQQNDKSNEKDKQQSDKSNEQDKQDNQQNDKSNEQDKQQSDKSNEQDKQGDQQKDHNDKSKEQDKQNSQQAEQKDNQSANAENANEAKKQDAQVIPMTQQEAERLLSTVNEKRKSVRLNEYDKGEAQHDETIKDW
jgi:Ca-activated chloride channel family protein